MKQIGRYHEQIATMTSNPQHATVWNYGPLPFSDNGPFKRLSLFTNHGFQYGKDTYLKHHLPLLTITDCFSKKPTPEYTPDRTFLHVILELPF